MRFHLVSDEGRNNERPKLGLGYLASYLRKYAPKIDLSISFDKDDYLADISKIKPDVVGFSAMTPSFKRQMAKAKKIKDKFGLPEIIGGNHISLIPQDLPKWLDVGVVSEGEEVLLRLLKHYKDTGKLQSEDIPALVWWDKNNLRRTGDALLVEPIDKIPFPDWEFLGVGEKGPGHILTSRGCPFRCRFCEAGKFWKKYRSHSPEYVADEIEDIYKNFKRSELVIMDDLFFANKERIKAIAELLRQRKLHQKMRFEVIGRADLFNEEIGMLLRKMNVFAISFGMESGSEPILQYLKRETVTLDQIRKAVAIAKKHKMEVLGGFMVGTPGETEEDVKKTIGFIKELDLDQVGINVTTPLPGTELWEEGKKRGIIKNDQWDESLWGMKDVTAKTIYKKRLLTDIPKKRFLELLAELNGLQDWTHRRRRNEQLFRELAAHPGLLPLLKFMAHCFKRPREAWYNYKKGYYRKWRKKLT